MRIFITGATGFIGAAITKHLQTLGHEITVCVRDANYAQTQFPAATIVKFNFSQRDKPDYWSSLLNNTDIVINCVGVFNKSQQDLLHTKMPTALFKACEQNKVKSAVHISALGIEQSQTLYATSKKAAEDFILTLNMPITILRPSLVYASGSYGGTSLFRALASLPFILPIVGNGKQLFQPIALKELCMGVSQLISNPPTKPIILSAVGKEQVSLREFLSNLRRWLGFPKAFTFRTPKFLIKWLCQLGDKFKSPVINSTAYQMLSCDNVVSDSELEKFTSATHLELKPFKDNLFSMPSYVQDRWHARLYCLRPLLRVGIGLTWLFSGIFSLINFKQSLLFLTHLPISSFWHWPLLIGASVIDILLGLASLANYRIKLISLLQILFIVFYTLIISVFLTSLWLDPFGAILKNIVFVIATLVFISISEQR